MNQLNFLSMHSVEYICYHEVYNNKLFTLSFKQRVLKYWDF